MGHSGSAQGDGKDQAAAWAAIFEIQLRLHPKEALFFFTGGGYGHTGIVCQSAENGSILF